MFKSQRINGTVYIESGDGRIKLVYPYKSGSQVKGLVDAAELMLPEDDPQLQIGVSVSGVDDAVLGFARRRSIDKIPDPEAKRVRKHRYAKRLVDEQGTEFKLSDMIEEKIRAEKGHKVLLADIVEEIKHHYVDGAGNPNLVQAKNAIRVSAMKSGKFGLAGDYVVLRVTPTQSAKKPV